MTLDEYIEHTGRSEKELADAVGCTQPTINRLRNRVFNPSLALMRAIASATDGMVTPNDFLLELEGKFDETAS